MLRVRVGSVALLLSDAGVTGAAGRSMPVATSPADFVVRATSGPSVTNSGMPSATATIEQVSPRKSQSLPRVDVGLAWRENGAFMGQGTRVLLYLSGPAPHAARSKRSAM